MISKTKWIVAIASAALLSACGGGGGASSNSAGSTGGTGGTSDVAVSNAGGTIANPTLGVITAGLTNGGSPDWSYGSWIGSGGTSSIRLTPPTPGYFVPGQAENPSILQPNQSLALGPAYGSKKEANIDDYGLVMGKQQTTYTNANGSISYSTERTADFAVTGHYVFTNASTQYVGFNSTAPKVLPSDIVEVKGKLNEFDNSIDASVIIKHSTVPAKYFTVTLGDFNNVSSVPWVDSAGSAGWVRGMIVKAEFDSYVPTPYIKTQPSIVVPATVGNSGVTTCITNPPSPNGIISTPTCTTVGFTPGSSAVMGLSTYDTQYPYARAEGLISKEVSMARPLTSMTRFTSYNYIAGVGATTSGYVNSKVGSSQFAVRGMIVDSSAAVYSGGSVSDIKPFALVTVTGNLQSNGVFFASAINIDKVAPLIQGSGSAITPGAYWIGFLAKWLN
jgi:hypothetical protein